MTGGFHLDRHSDVDAWPYTRRPLPWLLAGFLAMIFLVPFECIHLKVSVPFSSDLDRFYVALIVGAWAVVALVGRSEGVIQVRSRGWAAGMMAFVLVATASIAVNVGRITNLGEWETAQKKLAVLAGLVAIFAIVTLTLRVAELRRFTALVAILATATGLATIYEQKTGYNVFYETASTVLSPVATVDPAPTDISPDPNRPGRPLIVGPTRHPLSTASILGMALPFAVVLAAIAPTTRRRLLWGAAACVIFAGALVTQRRSGVLVPGFALVALFAFRPQQLLRLAPYGLVALAVGLAMSGGQFSSVQAISGGGNKGSNLGRSWDYPAILPDLLNTPLLGRGYGTLDSLRADTYRIFDNEYLGQVYEGGVLGLIAFIALIITPLLVVRPVLRSDHPLRGPPALAAGAACLAFGVAAALYDILSFSQAPYLFLYAAAMCTCAAGMEVRLRPQSRREAMPLPVNA